jgi:hypothetical protein
MRLTLTQNRRLRPVPAARTNGVDAVVEQIQWVDGIASVAHHSNGGCEVGISRVQYRVRHVQV